MCRVSVRAMSMSVAADLALPRRVELGELLPHVVELVGERPEAAQHWTLSTMGGSILDESMTLEDNGVRDGDVLRLGVDEQVFDGGSSDVCHYVGAVTEAGDRGDGWSRRRGAIAFLWSTGAGSTALAWPSDSAASVRGAVAAVLALVAALSACLASRFDADTVPTLSLGVTAVAFGAVAGFLMVPGGPAPPNWLLAAVVCAAMAVVLLHATAAGTSLYVAIAALSTMWAIAAAIVAVWPARAATVGAALAAVSLAMLAAAGRITVAVAGLTPHMPSAGGPPTGDEDVPRSIGVARAERAHRTLTGLLVGFALSTASGAVLVAADQHHESPLRRAAFTVIVAAALIVRVAHHVGVVRSTSLLLAGLISATASFAVITSAAPQVDPWLGLIAVALGAGALIMTRTGVSSRLTPSARRAIEIVDYVALAAVVPLACLVGGLFGFVRGMGLS